MRLNFALKGFAASVVLLSASTAAMAEVDADKVVELLKSKVEAASGKLEVASAELSDQDVVLKGAKITFEGGKEPIDLGEVTLEEVTEQDDGYVIGRIGVDGSEKVDGDTKISFKGAAINNLELMPADAENPASSFLVYDSIEFSGVEVAEKGTKVFALGTGEFSMSPFEADKKVDMEGKINDIYINFASSTDPQVKQVVSTMGYNEVSGKFSMKGSWNPSDGRMSLPEMTYDFTNVGKLNIAMDISGYTPAFAKQMQEITKSLAASGSSDQQSMAMIGLVQQLTFNGMSIRFDDASITNKIIDYVAKTSNQPREAIVAQGKGMAPMLAMALQDATLIQKVSEAIGAFLDNPKSLEIKAAPAQPISFAVLAASGMSAPAQLAQQLGLTVNANQ